MVKLMLHDAGEIALHPFVMGLQVVVEIGDMHSLGTNHVLTESGNGEATLFHGHLSCLIVGLYDMGVDKCMTEALVLRIFILEHIEVDDNNANGLAYLWRCQADPRCGIECLKHITDELLKIRIICGNILGNFSQHGLPISINR